MQNKKVSHYIDKTKRLEEGIRRFPSIYIEGNAALGKTVAVNMLLEKHPEIRSVTLWLDRELGEPDKLIEQLYILKQRIKKEQLWIVLENVPEVLSQEIAGLLAEMVQGISGESRLLFVSREKPQMEFLELLWKGKMTLIPWEELLLKLEDVRRLGEYRHSRLDVQVVYEKTGGWAGCVDLLFRLPAGEKSEEELLDSYEVRQYILQMMLSVLNEEEKSLLSHVAGCPWVNEELCKKVWQFSNAREQLENLHRKGFLAYEAQKKHWSVTPLFQRYISRNMPVLGRENEWYEAEGYIAETLWCLKTAGAKDVYENCLLSYYDRVHGLGLVSEEIMIFDNKQPEYCYLRGVHYYNTQNFGGLKKEIEVLEKIKDKTQRIRELILNLNYLNVEMPLTEWLDLLAEYTRNGEKFRLYQILGGSVTYLCGLRDLSGMFACTKKEENLRGNLWKTSFGETEWKCYQLARMDFYLETERKEDISDEDWELLREINLESECWQLCMAKLYLLCKLQRIQSEEIRVNQILELEEILRKEKHPVCPAIADSISSLYAPWYGAKDRITKWLRYKALDSTVDIREDNYLAFYCCAKGYIWLNQYERAEKILKKLIPYLQQYHRYRLASEVFFQYALVNWNKELHGQAVKNAIESFLLSRNSRYVNFYAGYGQKGQQVLEAYIEWLRSSTPEGWSHKKKYNYGNVLRMPVEDYMQVILRCTKKILKTDVRLKEEHVEERLTMMETIVLQDIGLGMSNAQICEELDLKMPTVKGHVYSLFKKLGVNSRVQAVLKGKELGIIE